MQVDVKSPETVRGWTRGVSSHETLQVGLRVLVIR